MSTAGEADDGLQERRYLDRLVAAERVDECLQLATEMHARDVERRSQLELARVYQKRGDEARARIAYQNFLSMWKDADPDVPLLLQAKAEYAKLQQSDLSKVQ